MEIQWYRLGSGLPNKMKFIVVYENDVYNQKQAVWATCFFPPHCHLSLSETSCPASTQAKPHADFQSDNAIMLLHISFVSRWFAMKSRA